MTWYDANFGSHKSGLATVGYREVNNIGGDAVARTTTGVVDAGNGMYGVDVTLNVATVSIQWDTGEAVPIYAVQSINLFSDLDAKLDLILLDTAAILVDTALIQAQNVLIFADTQMLRDIEDGHDIREILRIITASANGLLLEPVNNQIDLYSLDGGTIRQRTLVDVSGQRLTIVFRDFTP